MKISKIIGIAIILLFLGVLVLMPSNLDVKVEKTIETPLETVYYQVVRLPEWLGWSPWEKADSTRLHEFKQGNAETYIGGVAEWTTLLPNSSDGRYEVVDAKFGEYVVVDVYIYKASKDEKSYTFKFQFEPANETGQPGTKVTWSMTDTANFFKINERMQIPALVEQFTQQFEEGLDNLVKYAHEMELFNVFPRLDIQPNNMSYFLYSEIETEADRSILEKNYNIVARKVFEFTMEQKLQFREPPLIKIPLWDVKNNKARIQYGFVLTPIQKEKIEPILPADMKIDDISSPILISAELTMPEKPIEYYNDKLLEYIEYKGYQVVGDRMERYMSNPDIPHMPKHIVLLYPLITK